MIRNSLIRRCLADIDLIISSPKVSAYLVGYTKNISTRRRAYKGEDIHHIFPLSENMSSDDAVLLEKELQNQCCLAKCNTTRYKKYHPEKRDRCHKKSKGGISPKENICLVYMACF